MEALVSGQTIGKLPLMKLRFQVVRSVLTISLKRMPYLELSAYFHGSIWAAEYMHRLNAGVTPFLDLPSVMLGRINACSFKGDASATTPTNYIDVKPKVEG